MKILILGAGRIGSTLAFHFSKAGHEVTVVARGDRLRALQRDGAVRTVDDRAAPVTAVAALEPGLAVDLVIVTVPEYQFAPLLPALAASAARTVLLMFNSFVDPAVYREALGGERVALGFPNMLAFLEDQRVRFNVDGPGMIVTVSRPDLRTLFAEAGLRCKVELDMPAFLRSHAAMVVPLFVAGLWTCERPSALTWAESRRLAAAWTEGFALVRRLGHPLRPGVVAALGGFPRWLAVLGMWAFSRSASVRDVGKFGPEETRWLIDRMVEAKGGPMPHLLAIRP
ncbi:ketopantoate reductase family protein [Roseateles chitinivorans]|uniref:ketopantoate reductase family protein n=1 Tax=Roseateles chitinivorans TaxID=2917965 RepID=UPI003D67A0D1